MPAWRAEYPMPDVGRALVASLFRSNKTEKCKLATVGFTGILGERSGGMTGSLGGISRDACNAYRMGINNQWRTIRRRRFIGNPRMFPIVRPFNPARLRYSSGGRWLRR
jgi:hypothetical protein